MIKHRATMIISVMVPIDVGECGYARPQWPVLSSDQQLIGGK